jgi:hypothetical protein
MKKNWLLFGAIALLLIAAVLIVSKTNEPTPAALRSTTEPNVPAHNHSSETRSTKPKLVPAFEVAPTRASLGPTLDPERFTGLTRDAYRAVKEIPVTIAQLPCYCHCDQGFGHKSLYSCFEDDHAAHCAVCVNEALLALRLEREQKMTPAQIREQIVAQYTQ